MFKLIDRRPTNGPTINLKPYSGYSIGRKSNPHYINNDTAISALHRYTRDERLKEVD